MCFLVRTVSVYEQNIDFLKILTLTACCIKLNMFSTQTCCFSSVKVFLKSKSLYLPHFDRYLWFKRQKRSQTTTLFKIFGFSTSDQPCASYSQKIAGVMKILKLGTIFYVCLTVSPDFGAESYLNYNVKRLSFKESIYVNFLNSHLFYSISKFCTSKNTLLFQDSFSSMTTESAFSRANRLDPKQRRNKNILSPISTKNHLF